MKIKVLFIAMLLLLIGFFPVNAEETTTTMYVICKEQSVNVRAKPSSKSKIEGYLDFGWDVVVTDSQKDGTGTIWYKVEGTTELGYGWVCGMYLINSKPERVQDMTATVKANGRVATYKRVNGERKGWAKPGTKVDIKIYSTEWCLTNKGYIKTEYLEGIEK